MLPLLDGLHRVLVQANLLDLLVYGIERVVENVVHDVRHDFNTIHCENLFFVVLVLVDCSVDDLHAYVHHLSGLLVVLLRLLRVAVWGLCGLGLTGVHQNSLDLIQRKDSLELEVLQREQATFEQDYYLVLLHELVLVDAVAELGLHLAVEFFFFILRDIEEVWIVLVLLGPDAQVVATAADL